MRRLRTIIVATLAITSLIAPTTVAQQKQAGDAPTGLVLEITYRKGSPPAYLSVPGPDSKGGSAWYAGFQRIPSWKPPAGSLPVRAINIVCRVEGSDVRVKVSAYTGVRFHEKEEPVATYLVRENEKISIGELSKIGVEPFEISVVRVTPSVASPPQVVNKTKSLEVINVEPINSTLPSYKLSLQNLSGKNISALALNVLVGDKKRLSSLPHKPEGQPLIEAGAVYETRVSGVNNARITSNGHTPDSPPAQTIEIASVVFEDGTYEGDAQTAAQFRAFVKGRKTQLTRVVSLFSLFQIYSEASSLDTLTAVEKLNAQVSSLSNEVGQASLDELLREFPDLDLNVKTELKGAMEVAVHGVKRTVLDDIAALNKNRGQALDANGFRAWLSASKEKYEKWLSRL